MLKMKSIIYYNFVGFEVKFVHDVIGKHFKWTKMFQSTVPNNRYVNVTLYLLIKSLNATVLAFEVDKEFEKPFQKRPKNVSKPRK